MQIRQDKNSYRRKLEQQLEQNNNREIWTGLKKVLGHRKMGVLHRTMAVRSEQIIISTGYQRSFERKVTGILKRVTFIL